VLSRLKIAALVSSAAMFCVGCNTIAPGFEPAAPAFLAPPPEPAIVASPPEPTIVASPPEEEYVRTNEPTLLGRKHFERGHYGLSARYFREAVERDPRDLDSWSGLGASYDNLKRFDLADRAYRQALRLGGPSAPLLNNMGYSYMLRGDFRRARSTLRRALNLEPTNEVVLNNIRLLDGAQKPLPGPRP